MDIPPSHQQQSLDFHQTPQESLPPDLERAAVSFFIPGMFDGGRQANDHSARLTTGECSTQISKMDLGICA